MPPSSAISLIVIFVSGFFRSRFFSDCSSARFVTCDMLFTPSRGVFAFIIPQSERFRKQSKEAMFRQAKKPLRSDTSH